MKAKLFVAVLILIGLSVSANEGYGHVCDPPCAFNLESPLSGCHSETGVTLQWEESTCYLTYYDVYFGTSSPPAYKWTVYPPDHSKEVPDNDLDPATTYYWYVVAVHVCDGQQQATTVSGNYDADNPASFKTKPGKAYNLDPNEESGVACNTCLDWDKGGGATAHDVYLGLSYNAVNTATHEDPEFKGTQEADPPNCPGSLSAGTLYYWRVDEIGGGCTQKGDIAYFTTASAPGQASWKSPAHEAIDVECSACLDWYAGAGATTHHVYFGTSYDAVNTATKASDEYKGPYDPPYCPEGMGPSATYYWRIDEENSCGTTKGAVWHFATRSVPGQAYDPDPGNLDTGVPRDTDLDWTPGVGAASHDVYFGTDYDAVDDATTVSAEYKGTHDPPWDPPGYLDPETYYYWRIDEKNSCGITKGMTWRFETCYGPTCGTLGGFSYSGLPVGTITVSPHKEVLYCVNPDCSDASDGEGTEVTISCTNAELVIPDYNVVPLGSTAVTVSSIPPDEVCGGAPAKATFTIKTTKGRDPVTVTCTAVFYARDDSYPCQKYKRSEETVIIEVQPHADECCGQQKGPKGIM
jgi:hypothetical protein